MSGPRVLGLDLSLTATGVAFPAGSVATWKVRENGMERLRRLREMVCGVCLTYTGGFPYSEYIRAVDLVVVEGYAMGMGRATHNHAIGELGGVIRLALHESHIPYVDVPPATLKTYATGKGKASKVDVVVAATQRLGLTPADDNQADAAWLRALGMDALGSPLVALPQTHRRALDKLPDLALLACGGDTLDAA